MKHYLLLIFTLSSFLNLAQSDYSFVDSETYFEYALYLENKETLSMDQIKDVITKQYPELTIIDEFPEREDIDKTMIFIGDIENVEEDYVPQDQETLDFFGVGLNEDQKDVIQDSEYVILLDFFSQQEDYITTINTANNLMLSVVELIDTDKNFLWDEFTRETYTAEAWKEYRVDIDASFVLNQITTHFYQDGQYCRIITLGLQKYGLPDLVLNETSCNDGTNPILFLALLSQSMQEGNIPDDDGIVSLDLEQIKNEDFNTELAEYISDDAEKKADILLQEAEWKDGDPDNIIMEVYFPSNERQASQMALFSKLFGFEDEVYFYDHTDEVLEASERAKERLPELFELFNSDKRAELTLFMKFAFTDEEDEEWMWIEIIEWEEDLVSGILINEPYYVKDLKLGQSVKRDPKDMFDYYLVYVDGTEEGNETEALLLKTQ